MKLIEALETGKKVKRKGWCDNFWIYKNGYGHIINANGKTTLLSNSLYEEDDWEVVK